MNRYYRDPISEKLKEDARRTNEVLASQLRGKALICEIEDFGRTLYEELIALEKRLLEHDYWADYAHLEKYRCVHAVWLVFEGVFRYRGGNFWDNTSVGEIADANLRRDLGTLFEETVRLHRLEGNGIQLPPGGPRFVTRILFHGGIPLSAAKDYLRLLTPAAESHLGTAEELIGQWRGHPTLLTHVDMPIRRFLTGAGAVAVDFVDRTVDFMRLGRAALSVDLPECAIRAGIPHHLVAAYDDIRRETRRDAPPSPYGALTPPYLTLDPYSGTGPRIALPAEGAPHRRKWQLAGADHPTTSGSWEHIHEVAVTPGTEWKVELHTSDGRIEDTYTVRRYGEAELYLFDGSSLAQVDPMRRLRSRSLYVVHRRTEPLVGAKSRTVRSISELEGDLPPLQGPWKDFKVSCINIGDLDEIRAGGGQGVALNSAAGQLRLDLTSQQVGAIVEEQLVFTGIPDLVISSDSGRIRGELTINGVRTRVNHEDVVRHGAGLLRHLAPPAPVYRINIRLQAGLGSDLKTRLVVIPGLSITWVLPDQRVSMVQETVPPAILQVSANGIPTETRMVPLGKDARPFVTLPVPGSADMSIQLPVPVLLWSFPRDNEPSPLAQGLHRITLQHLEHELTSRLSIRATEDDPARAIRLATLQGDVLMRRDLARGHSAGRPIVTDLRPFADTLRLTSHPVLVFEIECARTIQQVALVVIALGAEALELHPRLHGADVHISASWREAHPLAGRTIRLWNRTFRWLPPADLPVPPSARGRADFPTTVDQVPPGEWIAAIGIQDQWQQLPDTLPDPSARHVCTLRIGTPDDELEWIRRLPPGGMPEYERLTRGVPAREEDQATVEAVRPLLLEHLNTRLSRWEYGDFKSTRPLRDFALLHTDASSLWEAIETRQTIADDNKLRLAILFADARVRGLGKPHDPIAVMPDATLWNACPILAAASLDALRPTAANKVVLSVSTGVDPAHGAWPSLIDSRYTDQLRTLFLNAGQRQFLAQQLGADADHPLSPSAGILDAIEWMDDYARLRQENIRWLATYQSLVDLIPRIEVGGIAERISATWTSLPDPHPARHVVAMYCAALHAAFVSPHADHGSMALLHAVPLAPALVASLLARAHLVRWELAEGSTSRASHR